MQRKEATIPIVTTMGATALALSLLILNMPSAHAEFSLKGKSVTFIIGGGPGGGVDAFARTISPYLTKYLPGAPVVKISNMGASGGLQGIQYFYTLAAKDGTSIATTNAGPISEPLMGHVQVTYDVTKFEWIGSLTRGDTVCAVWHGSGLKTIEDARNHDVPMSATGATSAPMRSTLAVANLLGVRFRPVAGYDGGTSLLAIERGEVEGTCTTLGSLRTTRPDWIHDGKLRLLVNVSMSVDPEFPDVPRLIDLLKSDEDRQVLEFLMLPYEFNNPLILPPGTPPDAIAAWRKAFQSAVQDPDYLAEAAARLQKILPRSGEEVEALVKRMYATPKKVIERSIGVTSASAASAK
jgi:tripartite-type tricarboxylate transporter receptor subunit TctC